MKKVKKSPKKDDFITLGAYVYPNNIVVIVKTDIRSSVGWPVSALGCIQIFFMKHFGFSDMLGCYMTLLFDETKFEEKYQKNRKYRFSFCCTKLKPLAGKIVELTKLRGEAEDKIRIL